MKSLWRRLLSGWLGLQVAGCAMTHPGMVGQSDQKDIVVSARVHRQLSDDYYLFLEYTIENTTSQWQDLKFGDITLGGQDPGLITGEKLASWIEGAELKLQKAQYNTALILGSMAAVGSAAAITSNDNNTKGASTQMINMKNVLKVRGA
jgi:hypothetical protein